MEGESREPCLSCGRPTLRVTLRTTGGYCRKCRPGQPQPRPSEEASDAVASFATFQPLSDDLIPVFIPALSVLLFNLEKQKGSPLSEQEVHSIRDKAVVIALSLEHAEAFAEKRGYADINPANVWPEWLQLRESLWKTQQ